MMPCRGADSTWPRRPQERERGGRPTGLAPGVNALVVAQLTISLVLLVGAGLFLRSFQQVQAVDPGFGREPAAVMTFLTPTTRFTPDEARASRGASSTASATLPGVEAVGAISNLHLNPLSTQSSDFNVDGFEPPADYGAFVADRAEVDPGSSRRRASRSCAGATSTTPIGRTAGRWRS